MKLFCRKPGKKSSASLTKRFSFAAGVFLIASAIAFAVAPQTAGAGQLFASSFVDGQTGYAVGMSGTLLLTRDGGETWKHLDTGMDIDLYSVSFTTKPGTGYISGGRMEDSSADVPYRDTGYILKTTDGGGSWETIFEMDGFSITSLELFDIGRYGYMIGDDYHPENTVSKLFYTDTYGLVWTEVVLSAEKSYYLSGMEFSADGTVGFVIGSYMIPPEEGDKNSQPMIGSVVFRKAPDMADWTIVLEAENVIFRDIAFPPGEEKVYVIGNNGEGGTIVQASTNNGKTWKEMAVLENEVFFSIAFADRSVGLATGMGMTSTGQIRFVAKTENSGRNWRKVFVEKEHDLWDVQFASEETAVFTGGTMPVTPEPVQSSGKAVVVITKDGGKTFDKQVIE